MASTIKHRTALAIAAAIVTVGVSSVVATAAITGGEANSPDMTNMSATPSPDSTAPPPSANPSTPQTQPTSQTPPTSQPGEGTGKNGTEERNGRPMNDEQMRMMLEAMRMGMETGMEMRGGMGNMGGMHGGMGNMGGGMGDMGGMKMDNGGMGGM